MPDSRALPPSRRLLFWFITTMVAPAIGLGGLVWLMIKQDVQDQRERAVDLAAAALQRTIAQLDDELTNASASGSAGRQPLGADTAVVVFGADGLRDRWGVGLPYVATLPPEADTPATTFAASEAAEFQQNNFSAAIAAVTPLTRSSDPAIRASAWLRVARNQWKRKSYGEALAALDQLAQLGATRTGGLPAGLIAGQTRALILKELGRDAELKREASAILGNLYRGRWMLTRSTYEFSRQQAAGWFGAPFSAPGNRGEALAEAASALWSQWRSAVEAGAVRTRRTMWTSSGPVFATSISSGERLVGLLIAMTDIESRWREELNTGGDVRNFTWALTDAYGRAVVGRPANQSSRQSIRIASQTQLPWTVHAITGGGTLTLATIAPRTRLLIVAVVLMTMVMLMGAYFINRAISRELAAARLQSEFVASVSHEFRTPLTSMRQLSEMHFGYTQTAVTSRTASG